MFKKLKSRLMQNRVIAILCAIFVALGASGIASEGFIAAEHGVMNVATVLGAVIVVFVASCLMNITATNANTASDGLTSNGYTEAASITDLWPVGVALIVFVGLFMAVV